MSLSEAGVTRVTVILDKPADWESWFQLRREKAVVDGIWKYCDISKPKDELPKLIEPTKPLPSMVKAEATAISQLDAGQQAIYSDLLHDWRFERAEYANMKRREGELLMEISRTIATRHLYLINGKDDIYDRLITLKQQLAPTTAARSRELVAKYRALQEKPRGRNLEQWLDEWIHVTNQCREADLPETTGYRAQDDFLTVVRAIAPEWAGSAHQDLILKETTGRINEIQPLVDYIAQFRMYHRRIGPPTASLGTFATLGVAEQQIQNQKEEQSSCKTYQRTPQCVCGGIHWYKDCWYLVPDHPKRPKNFRPNKDMQAKVTEALRNPAQARRIKSILAQDGKTIEKANELLKLDDGKDSGTTSQSLAAYSSFSVTQPQQIKQKDIPTIINRWILDPGSNVHVCNSTRFGWRETRKADPQDILYAGGSKMAIQAWGKVTFNVNRPYGVGQIQLTNVALVEGFFTNVVSLSRCRAVGVQFDSGRDVIYQNHPSNVICSLQHKDGHWIIDADDNDRPTLSSFATALRRSYKTSREDRRPIAASHVEAHEIFAHASKEAIDHLNENVRGIALEPDARAPRLQECDTCIEAKSTAQIQRQYGYNVVVLKIDGERGYGLELYEIARQAGFKIELRAPDTAEQLGSAEKAGHIIITKARALRIQAGLPKSLSNELAITAARIANVTPTKAIGWKTPYEIIYGKQPSIAHFAPIGCKAYVLNKKLKKADKLASRTFIGYLVGYDSTCRI
ncbi:hypothetical protein A1F97_10938, partial [Pyrenophora tritici-repentis]